PPAVAWEVERCEYLPPGRRDRGVRRRRWGSGRGSPTGSPVIRPRLGRLSRTCSGPVRRSSDQVFGCLGCRGMGEHALPGGGWVGPARGAREAAAGRGGRGGGAKGGGGGGGGAAGATAGSAGGRKAAALRPAATSPASTVSSSCTGEPAGGGGWRSSSAGGSA